MSGFYPISKEISCKISNMGFVCACLVVSIHVWPHPIDGMAGHLDKILAGGVSCVAVPSFFCISGFLLASKIKVGNWKSEVRKRVITLVVPFLLWGLISMVAGFSRAIITDIILHQPFGTSFYKDKSAIEVIVGWLGLDLSKPPLSIPLWYLRTLFLFVLLSPGLFWLVKKFHWYAVGGMIAFYYLWGAFDGIIPEILKKIVSESFPLIGLTAFSLGMFLRQKGLHLGNKVCACCSLIAGLMLWAFSTYYRNISGLQPVIIACLGYALWVAIPERPFPVFLRQSAFPMYVMHAIFLGYFQLSLMAPKYFPTTSHLAGFLMHWIGAIILSIVSSVILHRFFPRVSSVLFGHR